MLMLFVPWKKPLVRPLNDMVEQDDHRAGGTKFTLIGRKRCLVLAVSREGISSQITMIQTGMLARSFLLVMLVMLITAKSGVVLNFV